MLRSNDRILTTHVGSLPRPDDVMQLLMAREQGSVQDETGYEKRIRESVAECVRLQHDAGIDIVNDGEWSKPDYSTYVKDRFTGFDGEPTPQSPSRDMLEFPEYAPYRTAGLNVVTRPMCNGPIAWKDFGAVQRDIDNLRAATADVPEAFMTAVSPGQVARFQGNVYYKTDEEYLWALGNVLKDEYEAIANAGFILQLDCPDLGSGWNNQFRDLTLPEFRKIVDLHLEVLNAATANIDPERMRLHLCWGNYSGPHNHDIPLTEIIEPVLRSRPAAVSFEGANPRHEHEWAVFRDTKLPDGKLVIPGVIDSTTNFIEHPEVVAQRIERFAEVVGRENVIAGADCGFATFAGSPTVVPSITWAKLASLVEGARIASARLWKR
ncbi:MAG TPA: cobalamin-independent methionine synthase II family protein [Dehalococcoidia bacterium]|nr:cobalamin-independent methionine synthase II family protein [Dehalococcoidia bacterium]